MAYDAELEKDEQRRLLIRHTRKKKNASQPSSGSSGGSDDSPLSNKVSPKEIVVKKQDQKMCSRKKLHGNRPPGVCTSDCSEGNDCSPATEAHSSQFEQAVQTVSSVSPRYPLRNSPDSVKASPSKKISSRRINASKKLDKTDLPTDQQSEANSPVHKHRKEEDLMSLCNDSSSNNLSLNNSSIEEKSCNNSHNQLDFNDSTFLADELTNNVVAECGVIKNKSIVRRRRPKTRDYLQDIRIKRLLRRKRQLARQLDADDECSGDVTKTSPVKF